jgi:hypothetical protein
MSPSAVFFRFLHESVVYLLIQSVISNLKTQAAVLEDALHKESKARDEALSQAGMGRVGKLENPIIYQWIFPLNPRFKGDFPGCQGTVRYLMGTV